MVVWHQITGSPNFLGSAVSNYEESEVPWWPLDGSVASDYKESGVSWWPLDGSKASDFRESQFPR